MTNTDDVTVEPEDELGGSAEAKLAKLRAALNEAKKERDEYLAGWQRSKADYVNLSRRAREESALQKKNGVAKLAESVITVFDSLEAALKGADREGASETVTLGLTQVARQLESALSEHGVKRFTPSPGETLDPERHEPIHTVATDDEKEDNTVLETLQSGYEVDGMIVRPARVSVKRHRE